MKQILFVLFFTATSLYGQVEEFGVLLNSPEAQDSYILYCDRTQTYLVDNCGNLYNTWPVGRNDYHLHPKLLDDGTLMAIVEFGQEYHIVEYDWSGTEVNRIVENDPKIILHYEVIKKDNGNYLTVGRNILTNEEMVEIGYDAEEILNYRYMDMVLELDPQGNIVWQWNAKDHIIQDRDPSKANYGVVADHPELLDMNVHFSAIDWSFSETIMINSFDYNPELEQVVVSLRKMGEIAIIDQSTTTDEAAGSTGGRYGKGGDILWRWGNPANYDAGSAADRQLYYQHNPNWIDGGPYKGLLTCFNNGLGRSVPTFDDRYSQVPVIDPMPNEDGSYSLVDGQYAPDGLVLAYDEPTTGTEFYSSYTSGAEFLDNGNVHITVGQDGRMIEINPEGEIVWDYAIRNDGYIYRSEKYTKDHPAFADKNMVPIGQIATNYVCELFVNTVTIEDDMEVEYNVYPNSIEMYSEEGIKYTLVNMQGQTLTNGSLTGSGKIDIGNYPFGIYALTLTTASGSSKTIKLLK